MDSQPVGESGEFDVKRGTARHYEALMGRAGHEHPPLTPSRSAISASDGAKSDAHDAPDPDLAEIATLWPKLPEHIRAAVMALVAARGERRHK